MQGTGLLRAMSVPKSHKTTAITLGIGGSHFEVVVCVDVHEKEDVGNEATCFFRKSHIMELQIFAIVSVHRGYLIQWS